MCHIALCHQNRHALVIGQHHYTESDELPEAEEDANEVAMALEKMGYYVHGPKEGLLARVDLKDVDAIKTAFEHFLHGQRIMVWDTESELALRWTWLNSYLCVTS